MRSWNIRKIFVTTAVLALVMSITAQGAQHSEAPFRKGAATPTIAEYLIAMKGESLGYLPTEGGQYQAPSLDMRHGKSSADTTLERKSPMRAFLYSAVIPGAGQLYTGSKFKAALFLGLEALTWTGHIVYHGKGEDNTDKYEAFADVHWSRAGYENFLTVIEDQGIDPETAFAHDLPEDKTQQYYEMIGKYDQFVYGWDDVDQPPDYNLYRTAYSANRMTYEDMRDDANNMYDRATASLIAMMVNHLASGVEAALAARSHNKHVDSFARRLSLRGRTMVINDEYVPMLTVSYKF